jgi:hypothetical protein
MPEIQSGLAALKLLERVASRTPALNFDSPENEFSVPYMENSQPHWLSGMVELQERMQILAAGSEPWEFLRELDALVAIRDAGASKEVTRIVYSEENGALMHLYMSIFLSPLYPQEVKEVATQGLRRLDEDRFRNDVHQFFAPGGNLGLGLEILSTSLRELSNDELVALSCGLLPEGPLQELCRAAHDQQIRDREFGELFLLAVWDNGGRAKVQAWLEEIAGPPAAEGQLAKGSSGSQLTPYGNYSGACPPPACSHCPSPVPRHAWRAHAHRPRQAWRQWRRNSSRCR